MNDDCTWNCEQYPETFMKVYQMGFRDGKDFGISIERERRMNESTTALAEKWMELIKKSAWWGSAGIPTSEAGTVHDLQGGTND